MEGSSLSGVQCSTIGSSVLELTSPKEPQLSVKILTEQRPGAA